MIVSVEEPPEVTEVGLKLAEAPAGTPEMLNETVCAAPAVVAVLMVLVPLFPCTRFKLEGLALIEKSFVTAPLTVKLTVVVWVALVPVPVTVKE